MRFQYAAVTAELKRALRWAPASSAFFYSLRRLAKAAIESWHAEHEALLKAQEAESQLRTVLAELRNRQRALERALDAEDCEDTPVA
jgi:hypothetical protein